MKRIIIQEFKKLNQGLILCHLPDNEVTPYVTWRYYVPQGLSSTSWGHYFVTLEEAEKDFLERQSKL